jgi:hypothetical protein
MVLSVILFCAFATIIGLLVYHVRLQKFSKDYIWIEFFTKKGTVEEDFYPESHGEIKGPGIQTADGKHEGNERYYLNITAEEADKRRRGESYIPSYEDCSNAHYPPRGFLSHFGVQMRKAVFEQGNPESLLRQLKRARAEGGLKEGMVFVGTSKIIGMRIDEHAGEIAMVAAKDIHDLQDKLKKAINPVVLYIVLALLVVLCSCTTYFSYKAMNNTGGISDGIEKLEKAMGIGEN